MNACLRVADSEAGRDLLPHGHGAGRALLGADQAHPESARQLPEAADAAVRGDGQDAHVLHVPLQRGQGQGQSAACAGSGGEGGRGSEWGRARSEPTPMQGRSVGEPEPCEDPGGRWPSQSPSQIQDQSLMQIQSWGGGGSGPSLAQVLGRGGGGHA